MANWLDKYEQGGLVLKKKTKDNYDLKANPNDVQASVGPGYVGLGYDTKGRDYSPAWGGQFQNGGNLWNTNKTAWVDSVNNANLDKDFVQRYYAKNHPPAPIHIAGTPKGSTSTHYMANDKTRAYPTVVNMNGKLQYLPGDKGYNYADDTKEYIEFKTPEQAAWYANNGYKKGTDVLKYQMGGGLPGATGMMYARTINPAPSNGKYTKKTKASAQDGKTMPKAYWASNNEREAYRNRLKEIGKRALQEGSDENFLIETPYHKLDDGNNCINGVCGLNTAAGLAYSNPIDKDRYLGNTKFSDAVREGKEDYYQVSGNFQVGDHIQYLNEKGAPHHSKMIYDITTNDKGDKEYHVIHNSGGKTFTENIYSEADMKDMLSGKMPLTASYYSKINVYRPGYTLDKPLIDKERADKTSPEAREALAQRKELQDWDATHNPGFEYSIRPESEYYKDQPEGMKKFINFANDDAKVTELAKKLNVGKDIVHDQLLNTFGELGQENKWADRWFGGTGGIENTIEKLFSPGNMSIGPGQIKFKTLDPELKENFGIKKASDLHDIEKVIPLMTAINVKNKQYMERQEEDLSTKLIGKPGTSADEIKYGVDRWVPYMYRGSLSDPVKSARKKAEANANEYRMSTKDRKDYINKYVQEHSDFNNFKTFDEGSYADRVYNLIDQNLQRTMPAKNFEQYNELMPVTVKAKKKQNGGELKYWQDGLDFKPKTISQNGSVIKDDMGQWAHPGEITEIGSNDITMQGVDYPVLGVSDTGDTQMMYPNQDYKFDGEKVTEFPIMKKGGWLNKYK